ncbi:hypothetical protein Tco_1125518 [Tanacetum coccineum]|uniref:Uncharacterized protein n=1 Tax=Tanacetum coccineum TaxID=301880 RepID=A0ABQ5JC88_9ASTR
MHEWGTITGRPRQYINDLLQEVPFQTHHCHSFLPSKHGANKLNNMSLKNEAQICKHRIDTKYTPWLQPQYGSGFPAKDTDIQEKEQKESQKQQIQARSGKDQVKSKSKVIHMKKIQLEGLKLPKPQVVLLR